MTAQLQMLLLPMQSDPRKTVNLDLDNKLERSRVLDIMKSGSWYSLFEIKQIIERRWGKIYSDASISARVRDFRKSAFGGYTVERAPLRDGSRTYLYRLVL